uniref:Uncharacterized protein n=1 Tax=Avena sativa TaxID=4498 RepID=A0ACD5XBN2_AVESA
MATPAKSPTSISPSAAALASNSTSSSSSCTNPSELSSPSPYFLPELIRLIARRLTSLQDFFALRAACRTYRAALTPSPANLASQAPLILVPHKSSSSGSHLYAPFRRLLRFRLPCTRPNRRDPSVTPFYAFGCRVVIHHRIKGFRRYRELRISHLLTGNQARLPNPPKYIDGLIFSGDLVLAFKAFWPVLYYCRIGDAHWQSALCQSYAFCSLIFVKGTLYGLIGPNYPLAVVEIHKNSVEFSFLGDKLTSQSVLDCSVLRLAECRGELLLVVAVQYSPVVCHVYQWHSGETKWVRITSPGGCSLFFHRHQFAGCVGPDHPKVRRDCMYSWSSGQVCEYRLVDGSWHRHVANYPARASMEDYVPLAWVLQSIV